MIKLVGLFKSLWQTFVQSDVVKKPCHPDGVSPFMHKALSCFTGAFLTGPYSPLVCRYGLKSTTLTDTLEGVRLRVERPSSENRSKDGCITFSFLALIVFECVFAFLCPKKNGKIIAQKIGQTGGRADV